MFFAPKKQSAYREISLFLLLLLASNGLFLKFVYGKTNYALISYQIQNEGIRKYKTFLKASTELYLSIQQNDVQTAAKYLQQVEKKLRNLALKEITSAEGINALVQNIVDLKRALASVQPDIHKLDLLAASLRLASDALANSTAPLWHQYRILLQNNLIKLEKQIGQQSHSGPVSKEVLQSLSDFKKYYKVVRTSASLTAKPWVIERADSALRYAEKICQAPSPTLQIKQSMVVPLKEAFHGIFPKKTTDNETTTLPEPAWPVWAGTVLLTTIILLTLSWVGWKKYQSQQ